MNDGISLYVHIPFCAAKCPYCSFAVAVGRQARAEEYLAALTLERAREGALLSSVYIGGGTPSCLARPMIDQLFWMIRRRFTMAPDAEVTFEMNPESVDAGKAAVLKDNGVTRISLGVQSLDDRTLSRLGRPHSADGARRALGLLRTAGFSNINADLIFGLPWQEERAALADIDAVMALGTEHLSLYALNVEEKSLFKVQGVTADEHAQAALYEEICRRAAAAGFAQYEISNFARPGFESRHNIHYWQGGEYVGLGMAAHSHIDGERFWNADTLPKYLEAVRAQGHARTGGETLLPAAKLMETFLFMLRMNRGADLHALEQRFGVEMSAGRKEILESFIEMGYLKEADMFVRATPRGRLVLDELCARLV